MKNTRLIIAICLIANGLYAQPEDLDVAQFREDFTEANLLMDEGYYNQALDLWLQMYNEDPTNPNLNYKIGFCYLKSSNEKKLSQKYFEAAENGRSDSYSSFNISDYDPSSLSGWH